MEAGRKHFGYPLTIRVLSHIVQIEDDMQKFIIEYLIAKKYRAEYDEREAK